MPRKQLIKPMLPGEAKLLPKGRGWVYEIKFDGYRMIATISNGQVTLTDKSGKNITLNYPVIVNELEGQQDMIIDGEIAVLDDDGKPDYHLLQSYVGKGDLVYYVFDLMSLEGEDWTKRPLIERKEMLLHVLKKDSVVTYCDDFTNGPGLFQQVKLLGLEGIICKRKDSIYEPGVSKEWLFIKVNERKIKVVKKLPDIYDAIMTQIKKEREKRLKLKG